MKRKVGAWAPHVHREFAELHFFAGTDAVSTRFFGAIQTLICEPDERLFARFRPNFHERGDADRQRAPDLAVVERDRHVGNAGADALGRMPTWYISSSMRSEMPYR